MNVIQEITSQTSSGTTATAKSIGNLAKIERCAIPFPVLPCRMLRIRPDLMGAAVIDGCRR